MKKGWVKSMPQTHVVILDTTAPNKCYFLDTTAPNKCY